MYVDAKTQSQWWLYLLWGFLWGFLCGLLWSFLCSFLSGQCVCVESRRSGNRRMCSAAPKTATTRRTSSSRLAERGCAGFTVRNLLKRPPCWRPSCPFAATTDAALVLNRSQLQMIRPLRTSSTLNASFNKEAYAKCGTNRLMFVFIQGQTRVKTNNFRAMSDRRFHYYG